MNYIDVFEAVWLARRIDKEGRELDIGSSYTRDCLGLTLQRNPDSSHLNIL
jgi:hypothetical protein